ncbi:hypothetical protein B2J93_2407 [Marssonina coronariae]|uniref:Uncharacterized protein n=1 Tax=Diplocarpon coronariae TaxID=2795749 RepID=A0A218Z1Y0_9HELO|nr:hypothetical protein B2J93_2407 [Marssonina coronariae]
MTSDTGQPRQPHLPSTLVALIAAFALICKERLRNLGVFLLKPPDLLHNNVHGQDPTAHQHPLDIGEDARKSFVRTSDEARPSWLSVTCTMRSDICIQRPLSRGNSPSWSPGVIMSTRHGMRQGVKALKSMVLRFIPGVLGYLPAKNSRGFAALDFGVELLIVGFVKDPA